MLLKLPKQDLHIQTKQLKNEANTELFHQSKKNIALFSDSIPRRIKFKELNKKINRGRIRLKAFPGARAQHLSQYLVPSLEEYEYDCAIIHVNINDILRHKDELKNLPEDILKIANSCTVLTKYLYHRYFHRLEHQ